MRKGNGKIGNFVDWAESRYGSGKSNGSGNGREEKISSPPVPTPQPVITYDLRNNRVYPDLAMYPQNNSNSNNNSSNNDVSQAKLRIAQAREENLALKRIIAQKNMQNINPSTQATINPYSNQNSKSQNSPLYPDVSHQNYPYSSPQNVMNQGSTIQQQPIPSQTLSKNQPQNSSSSPSDSTNHHPPLVPSSTRPPSNHSLPTQQASAAPNSTISPASTTPDALSDISSSQEISNTKKKSKKNEKRKLKKEKESEQRSLLEQSIVDLKRFSDHLDAAIDDNKKLLAGELTIGDTKISQQMDPKMTEAEKENKKKMKLEEKQKRQKLKLQMDSLLRGQILNILPRWRHRLRGTVNPKPEEILKGKSLFRVGYLMVMYFYVKPHLSVQTRKSQTKSSDMDSLLKSLLLLIDNTGHWIGKLVKIPLSSIIQDSTLNFQPIRKAERLPHTGTHTMRHRMIQIKVRMTSLIHSLTAVTTLPPLVQDFLVSLVGDGNYFKEGFLFEFEQRNLEFNKLGATRHMIQKPHEETLLALLSKKRDTSQLSLFTHENIVYDISRPRLLIKNFLILRILIYNVILSPWHYGASPQPKTNLRQIILNLRIFATILYEICRHGDPNIPAIQNLNEQKNRKHGRTLVHQDTHDLATVAELDHVNSALVWLTYILDNIMGSAAAQQEERNAIESALLGTRKSYDTLQGIQSFLFDETYFSDIRSDIDPWIKELSELLENWLMEITKRCVEIKINEEKTRLALTEQNLTN